MVGLSAPSKLVKLKIWQFDSKFVGNNENRVMLYISKQQTWVMGIFEFSIWSDWKYNDDEDEKQVIPFERETMLGRTHILH